MTDNGNPTITNPVLREMMEGLERDLRAELETLQASLEDPIFDEARDRAEGMEEGLSGIDPDQTVATQLASRVRLWIRRLAEIQHALYLLQIGKWGICEECGGEIETARMEACGCTATLCVTCADRACRRSRYCRLKPGQRVRREYLIREEEG